MHAPVDGAIAVPGRTPALLASLIDGMPAARVEAAADGDWSPRDLVAHLLTTETPFVKPIKAMAERDDPPLAAIDEGAILAHLGQLTTMPRAARCARARRPGYRKTGSRLVKR